MSTTDFLIIGAGIIGLTIARELQRRYPSASVTIIEKEARAGQHASGRNSGVLHSGIYYTADSLKARFTRDGNRAWQAYCDERGLPIDRCGKLVLAREEHELRGLETLEERSRNNCVEVQRLDERQVHEIEPRAHTCGRALFVPSTATVDPAQLVASQQADFIAAGGRMLCNHPYRANLGNNMIQAGDARISAGIIINCAGLHADRVAHDFGFGMRYSVLPFKGLYLYSDLQAHSPRAHIYPVPDLRNPFLGVHFTRTMDGGTKIGPTAIPALWREHYGGLRGFNARELLGIARLELNMLVTDRNGFRRLAVQELKKQRKANMVADAARLMSGAERMGFHRWGKPGIRAQLFDRSSGALEMDFVIEGDARSSHVLNAVSPAFTCALPFAAHVVDSLSMNDYHAKHQT